MAAVELIDRRDRHVKHFDTGILDPVHGLPIYRMVTQRGMHHRRADNKWYENDPNWDDTGTAFRPRLLGFDLDLNKSTRTLSLLFPGEASAVTLSPRNPRTPTVSRVGNRVTLAGLWRGIDLTFTLTPEGIKADYTRTSATFTTPSWTVTGPFAKYIRPAYYDDPTTGLTIPVATSLVGDVFSIDMGAVPIGVPCDPTLALQPDATAGKDTLLYSLQPDTNNSTSVYLSAGHNGSGVSRGLLSFDFSSIPPEAVCADAALSLWQYFELATNARTMRVYRMKQAWTEPATWNRYNGTNTWPGGAGGFGASDCEQTDIGSHSFSATETAGTQHDIALTPSAVQDWWDGGLTNNGMMLKMDTENNDCNFLDSSDSTTASERPLLTITYTAGASGSLLSVQGFRGMV